MRLIDAEAFRKKLIKSGWLKQNILDDSAEITAVDSLIDAMETIDAAPVVHGKWINDGSIYTRTCSVCGNGYGADSYNYCPSCGARMDGEFT